MWLMEMTIHLYIKTHTFKNNMYKKKPNIFTNN